MAGRIEHETVRILVTSAGLEPVRRTRFALKATVPAGRIRRTGFKGVFILEAKFDPFELAELICRECRAWIGHLTVVLAEVESGVEPIKDAAVRIGSEQIGADESFSFRLHKRGAISWKPIL